MKPQPIDNSPLIEKILTDIGLSDYGDTSRGRQVSELARDMLAAIQGVFGHSTGNRYIRYFAKTALETLRCRIEDGNSGVTWHKPQTVYEFAIDWDWIKGEEPGSPIFIHPSDSGALVRDFADRRRFLDTLTRISGYSGRYTFLRG